MTGFTLKIIAIIAMIFDHVGAVFFPEVLWFRIIGRLAMPLFAFLCAEGYHHTSNKKKYILRLLIFAFISEIPYDLMLSGKIVDFSYQNIMFSFVLGVTALYLTDHNTKGYTNLYPTLLSIVALIISSDYHIFAVITLVCFYNARYKSSSPKLVTALGCAFAGGLFIMSMQAFAMLSIIPIFLYNGKQGFKDKYYLFYWVYPLQFLVIYFISKLIY